MGAFSLWSRAAPASIVRGLTLEELVRGSHRIVTGVALESASHWVSIGQQRRIVTDTRVKCEALLEPGRSTELIVRTYGGQVGRIGELVQGEPQLVLGSPCLLFLCGPLEGVHYVMGMAQGHYPLRTGSGETRYLTPSPELPKLVNLERSALKRLVGQRLAAARSLIEAALRQ